MIDKTSYRIVLGQRLKEFRESRGLSVDQVAATGGMQALQVMAIERGLPCSVDEFISYIQGSDLYMYFAEKSEGRTEPHDFEDMKEKSKTFRDNSPTEAGLAKARRKFGEAVCKARKAAGLTQELLAAKAGIKQTHLARIESGRYNVTLDTIARLGLALGVDLI